MSKRLRASVRNGFAINSSNGDRGVVDDAVHDHFGDFGKNGCLVCGDDGEFPRQLVCFRKWCLRRIDFDVMSIHLLNLEPPHVGSYGELALEMAGLALKEFSAAEFTDELAIAG